jgi:glycosyltransferase involved in cell wall biosynthesis
MHIGIVSAAPFPPRTPEGISSYVHNLVCKLLEKRHRVTIITRGSMRPSEDLVSRNLRVFRVPLLPVYPFHVHVHGLFVNRLLKLLEPELDVVHAHSPYVPAVISKVPLLTTIHTLEKVDVAYYEKTGLDTLRYTVSARIFSSVESELFRHSDMLTAVSGHIFQELNDAYHVMRSGVVLGNGVDERRFVPPEDKSENKRESIVFVGRMDYRKGLFDLLKCAKSVCKARPSAQFILVGTGPLQASLSKETKRTGIDGNVTFTGYVSQDRLIELYQSAMVSVVPSLYEGLPTVMLEAMACGLPVVATRIGAHVDVISHGLDGLLVPPASPDEMAERILALLANQDLRQEMGAKARETIEARYTWDKVSEKVLQCYQTVVDSSRA